MPDRGDHDAAIWVVTMGGLRTSRASVSVQRWALALLRTFRVAHSCLRLCATKGSRGYARRRSQRAYDPPTRFAVGHRCGGKSYDRVQLSDASSRTPARCGLNWTVGRGRAGSRLLRCEAESCGPAHGATLCWLRPRSDPLTLARLQSTVAAGSVRPKRRRTRPRAHLDAVYASGEPVTRVALPESR